RVDTVHDCSDGGLLIAIAEMAMAGDIGASVQVEGNTIPGSFGEDQARYVLAVPASRNPEAIVAEAGKAGSSARIIGGTGGANAAQLSVSGAGHLDLHQLRTAHEGWFPKFMGSDPV